MLFLLVCTARDTACSCSHDTNGAAITTGTATPERYNLQSFLPELPLAVAHAVISSQHRPCVSYTTYLSVVLLLP
jgi:hypothetical protein